MRKLRKPRNVRVRESYTESSVDVGVSGMWRAISGELGRRMRELGVSRIELLDKKPLHMPTWESNPWLQLVGIRGGVLVVYQQPYWCVGGNVATAMLTMCPSWQRYLGVPVGKTRWARMRFRGTPVA